MNDAPAAKQASVKPPDAPAPEVRLSGGALSYHGETLFENLDLTLAAGRTTCLLGPSGVGKSSLLRLLAGLGQGAQGQVADAGGRPLSGRVAYMAQQDLLLPWWPAWRNVALGAFLRNEAGDAAREKALRLLAAVGLEKDADKRPAQLSGGMRQRAALARTLFEERPCVLMDEPFSALDAITRFELQGLAARLLKGRTVLLVTHDPLEALRLGDRILVMAGRPARLTSFSVPSSQTPREPGEPAMLEAQSALLAELLRSKGSGA